MGFAKEDTCNLQEADLITLKKLLSKLLKKFLSRLYRNSKLNFLVNFNLISLALKRSKVI